MRGDFFGRHVLHVAQQQRGSLAAGQHFEPASSVSRRSFRSSRCSALSSRELASGSGRSSRSEKLTASGAAQKIDGRIAGDPREPVRGLLQILQLIVALQGLDEGFLGEILSVGHVAHNAVDQQEHAAMLSATKRLSCSGESGASSNRVDRGASPMFSSQCRQHLLHVSCKGGRAAVSKRAALF